MGRYLELAQKALREREAGRPQSSGQQAYEPPSHVIDPDGLPAEYRELYEERAAIREYDGEQPRPQAEAGAWRDVVIRMDEANVICLGIKNVISLR